MLAYVAGEATMRWRCALPEATIGTRPVEGTPHPVPVTLASMSCTGGAMDVVASWETIIDRETHDAVVAALTTRRESTPVRKPRHIESMIVPCGVSGEPMRSAGDGHGIAIYRCATKALEGHPQYKDGKRLYSIRVQFVDQVAKREVLRAFGRNPLSVTTTEGNMAIKYRENMVRSLKSFEVPGAGIAAT